MYDHQMELLLSDSEIYDKFKGFNTMSIQQKMNTMISNWERNAYISDKDFKYRRTYNGVSPRIYGLD